MHFIQRTCKMPRQFSAPYFV